MNNDNSSEDQFKFIQSTRKINQRSSVYKESSLFIVLIVKFMTLSTSFYTIFNSRMFLKFYLFISSFIWISLSLLLHFLIIILSFFKKLWFSRWHSLDIGQMYSWSPIQTFGTRTWVLFPENTSSQYLFSAFAFCW